MKKEYYLNGRILFHLGLRASGKKNKWSIITNIPIEILERNREDITAINVLCQGAKLSQEKYLDLISEVIINDKCSRHFYYPDFLLTDSEKLPIEVFEFLTGLIEDLELEPLSFYSENYKPVQFYVLQQKFNRLKFFYPEEFQNIVPCLKKEFERNIPCPDAAGQYCDYYADFNEFLHLKEDETDLYFLMRGEKPCMIMVG